MAQRPESTLRKRGTQPTRSSLKAPTVDDPERVSSGERERRRDLLPLMTNFGKAVLNVRRIKGYKAWSQDKADKLANDSPSGFQVIGAPHLTRDGTKFTDKDSTDITYASSADNKIARGLTHGGYVFFMNLTGEDVANMLERVVDLVGTRNGRDEDLSYDEKKSVFVRVVTDRGYDGEDLEKTIARLRERQEPFNIRLAGEWNYKLKNLLSTYGFGFLYLHNNNEIDSKILEDLRKKKGYYYGGNIDIPLPSDVLSWMSKTNNKVFTQLKEEVIAKETVAAIPINKKVSINDFIYICHNLNKKRKEGEGEGKVVYRVYEIVDSTGAVVSGKGKGGRIIPSAESIKAKIVSKLGEQRIKAIVEDTGNVETYDASRIDVTEFNDAGLKGIKVVEVSKDVGRGKRVTNRVYLPEFYFTYGGTTYNVPAGKIFAKAWSGGRGEGEKKEKKMRNVTVLENFVRALELDADIEDAIMRDVRADFKEKESKLAKMGKEEVVSTQLLNRRGVK